LETGEKSLGVVAGFVAVHEIKGRLYSGCHECCSLVVCHIALELTGGITGE